MSQNESIDNATRLAHGNRVVATGESTQQLDNAALIPFHSFLESIDYPANYKLLTEEHVKDDRVHVLLADYRDYLLAHPLLNKKTNKPLQPDVVLKYFKRIRVLLSNRFKDHPYLKDPEVQTMPWWKDLHESFGKALERKQVLTEVVDTSTLPLYQSLSNRTLHPLTLHSDLSNATVSNIDLNFIQRQFFKNPSRDSFRKMAYVATTYHSDGRGGEFKFQKLTEFRYDAMLKIIVGTWRESKTLSKYAVSYLHNKYGIESYLTCWNFCMFLYVVMADGFMRSDSDFDSNNGIRASDSLFIEIRNINNENVARTLNTSIRKHIPKSIEKFYSRKSLRIAATTLLQMHPDINEAEELARSGHASGNNSDRYIDRSNPMLTLPGGLCLAGFDNCHMNPVSPSLDILMANGEDFVTIQNLVDMLVHYHEEDDSIFGKQGRLRPMLESFVASGILYFNDVRVHHPGHAVVQHMINAAVNLKIGVKYNKSALEVLIEWSNKVKEDYISRSKEVPLDNGSITKEIVQLRQELALLWQTVRKFFTENVSMYQHILMSPNPAPRTPERVSQQQEVTTPVTMVQASSALFVSSSSSATATTRFNNKGNDGFAVIMEGSKKTAGGTGRNMQTTSMTIAEAIEHFHSRKLFGDKTSKSDIGGWCIVDGVDKKSKAKVSKCLELVAELMSDEDFNALKQLNGDQCGSSQVKQCAREIQLRVMNQYRSLFGFGAKSKVKANVQGVGGQIAKRYVEMKLNPKVCSVKQLVQLLSQQKVVELSTSGDDE